MKCLFTVYFNVLLTLIISCFYKESKLVSLSLSLSVYKYNYTISVCTSV